MNTYLDYDPILLPIAAEFGRKFRRYGADTEDIAQELRVWVFRHPETLARWERETEEQEQVDRLLARTLRNEANRYCQEVKAQALGYSYDDLAFYSRGELAVLVAAMFDREAWLEPPVSEDGGRSQRDPATGGNWIATLADVSRAYSQLSEQDRALLSAFHKDGMTNVMLAELHGVSPQAMSQKHIKALNRLQKKLGGERPQYTHTDPCECEDFVGTRRVVSNATARAITESVYDED